MSTGSGGGKLKDAGRPPASRTAAAAPAPPLPQGEGGVLVRGAACATLRVSQPEV